MIKMFRQKKLKNKQAQRPRDQGQQEVESGK